MGAQETKKQLQMQPSFSLENSFNNLIVAGIDEAGRGPLAGPVVAACVILDQNNFPSGINDSKKLSPKKRAQLFDQIKASAKIGLGIAEAEKIDQINILEATKLAMFEAYKNLHEKYSINPQLVLVDGNVIPFKKIDEIEEIIAVVKGDQKSLSIAAASIVAKEVRDRIMKEIDLIYPQYGFAKHSGYPTEFHIQKIKEFGICKFHRKSFSPCK